MRKVLFILGELDDADLQWMIDAGTVHDAADGEALIEEGVANHKLIIVVDGEISVRLNARGGTEFARLGKGEMAGEMSLLDSRPPNATLVAIGPTRVFQLEHAAMRRKMERDTSFAAHFYRAVSLFLANRLIRAQLIGTQLEPQLSDEVQDTDELSPELMDNLSHSGRQFLTFLERLQKA